MRTTVMTAVLLAGLATGAAAQPAAGVAPVILRPADGAVVSNPVTVEIGSAGGDSTAAMPGMSGMNGMSGMGGGAHYHLLVDAPLPDVGKMMPMDAHHIHLMGGQTRTTLRLAAGQHTLQLILGNASHTVTADAPRSAVVTFQVK